MSNTAHEAPERIVPSCVEALESYQQADMDGIMVLVSRQAIHETIDAYWARVKTCEELEAKLAQAVEVLDRIETASEYFAGLEAPEAPYRYAHETTRRLARAFLSTIQPEGKTDDKA